MRAPRIIPVVVTLVFLLGLSPVSRAKDERGYRVIVNPRNPVTEIDRDFLRDAYLRKTRDWAASAAGAIRPVDLATKFAVRERFTHDILKKTPQQLKNYWNQQIFSGKSVPPPEADSTAAVVAYVLANPGGIGYLPADADVGDAKVIGLK